jgi:pimeloyl-ACP methyl ester carboxylesterase
LEANKTDWHAVVSSLASVMEDDFIDTLEDMLDIPVMLVYGGQNNLVQPPSDDDLDYMGNNINAFVLDEAQHYPMLEETSKFNRLLLDFLLKKDNWDEIKVKGQWRRRVR